MAKGDSYAASQLFMGLTPKNGYKASKLYCYKPTDGSGDFTWARNINSYRLNQSGLLELMGNNVPRIDYTNTCPELLIEEASTNLLIRSETFDNADWIKNNVTVTANNINAPNGLLTAEKIEITATNTSVFIGQNSFSTYVSGETYTASVYAKKGTTNFFQILFSTGQTVGNAYANFNLNLGTASLGAGVSANIKDVGNGWYRCSLTYISNVNGSNDILLWLVDSLSANRAANYTGSIGSYLYFWGAQQEQGTYATSYIPTINTTQTRPQDTNSSDIAFTGDGFSYNLRVRLENRSDSGTPDNIFFIEDSAGLGDTYIGCYVLGDNLVFTFYNNPELHEFSISLLDGIHNIGVSFDCTNGAYEIVIDGVSEFSGTIPDGYLGANIYESVKLGCLGASTDSIGLNRIIGLQVYDAVLTQGELIEYTS
jgi:hypothetical protein